MIFCFLFCIDAYKPNMFMKELNNNLSKLSLKRYLIEGQYDDILEWMIP